MTRPCRGFGGFGCILIGDAGCGGIQDGDTLGFGRISKITCTFVDHGHSGLYCLLSGSRMWKDWMCVVGIVFRAEDSSYGMQSNPPDLGAAIWGSCHPSTLGMSCEFSHGLQICLPKVAASCAWHDSIAVCKKMLSQVSKRSWSGMHAIG